ncbi:DUF1289 domain-containing protein [Curvivirga sp.]|uniref:DUF1289 domain-containing protein n=1 Tax=Curvivirga sp. TaxID=2856848 RepID=UPI003B58EB98
MSNLPEIPSPCTGVCKIEDDSQLCGGCLRTRDEIRNWRKSSNDDRLLVLQELKKRRMARGKVSESDLKPRRRRRSA